MAPGMTPFSLRKSPVLASTKVTGVADWSWATSSTPSSLNFPLEWKQPRTVAIAARPTAAVKRCLRMRRKVTNAVAGGQWFCGKWFTGRNTHASEHGLAVAGGRGGAVHRRVGGVVGGGVPAGEGVDGGAEGRRRVPPRLRLRAGEHGGAAHPLLRRGGGGGAARRGARGVAAALV